MTRETLKDTFYLIARYNLGKLECFVKIGDSCEEITRLYNDRYKSTPQHDFGVTEYSYQLLMCNALDISEGEENE